MVTLNNNKLLPIKFGNRCNLSCEYCIQKTLDKSSDFKYNPDILIPRVIELIENRYNNICDIFFVGGETLLYINQIKDIVSRLDSFIKNTNCVYSVFTNGYYLTDELVDYFNEHNFKITISWDGSYSKVTRGYNFFEDTKKVECAKNIKNLVFNMLITNGSLLLDKFDVLDAFNKDYLRRHENNIYLNFRTASSYRYENDTIRRLKEEIEIIKNTRYQKILESRFLQGLYKPLHKDMYGCSCDGSYIRNPTENKNERTLQRYIFCEKCFVKKYCVSHVFYPYKSIFCYVSNILYGV